MPRNYLRKLLISKGASKRKAASQVGLKESPLRKLESWEDSNQHGKIFFDIH